MVFLAQALEKYSFERPLSSGFTVLESEKTNLVAFLYFTAARINYTLVRYSKLLNLDKKMSHGRVDRLEKEQSRLTSTRHGKRAARIQLRKMAFATCGFWPSRL